MTGTKITMTGADEAHYLNATGLSSRVFRFPDGMVRHLTFTNAQWSVLDRLSEKRGWPDYSIPELSFQVAKQFCTDPALFEDELRTMFELFLTVNAARSLGLEELKSNDDRPGSKN